MASEAQTLANRRLGRRIVLNLGHFDFEIVSDFDIRISDFNHSGCFMQNKANLPDALMNTSSFITKDYENERLAEPEKQTQSNPICQRVKLTQSVYLQRIMKKNAAKGYEKTNPIPEKPKNEHNFYFNKGL